MRKIAVIGCGNMASPIVISMAKKFPNLEFHTYTPSKVKAISLAKNVGGVYHENLCEMNGMDIWLIACKPQQLNQLCLQLKGALKGQNIISILASVNIEILKNCFASNQVIRIMPNTPSLIGQGISLLFTKNETHKKFISFTEELFSSCGDVHKVSSERQFDELTAFSGSGPAYVFRFALGYFRKLQKLGYNDELARKLMDQLFKGASLLMLDSNESLEEMVSSVTSKGGVTIEAIEHLETNKLDQIISESIDQAITRGKQITQDTKASAK
ncbi:MAG: pyrroline-5-carboxylate reductase [Halobacteriovoraceae bacterium]|jgi:pyrroline-5-carboxylate reductase|nr:pyrroline-5-carboxylate reductase [Halobacteriovoraceae bacterium]